MIDKKDLRLLSLLREDSRISLTEMSKRSGIPISTLHERIKKLTE